MLRRTQCWPSCQHLRSGRARDKLLCYAAWIAKETEWADFLCDINSATVWFRILNKGEWEKRDDFSNIYWTMTFYKSLRLKQSSQIRDSGIWCTQNEAGTNFSFYIEKKKKKEEKFVKVFLINVHSYVKHLPSFPWCIKKKTDTSSS